MSDRLGSGSVPGGNVPGGGLAGRPPAGAPPAGAPPAGAPPMAGRPAGPGGGRGPGMMGMGMGLPPAKPKDLRASLRRLAGSLRPEAPRIAVVIVLAVVSVTGQVLGPKILGNAVTTILEGVFSRQMPAGLTQQQIVDGLRARGQEQQAEMVSAMHLNPGHGIDFGALGGVLGFLVGIYIVSSIFGWLQGFIMAGVTQRTVYRLRADVDRKLGRLPLKYFDGHPRGDTLSRVTNDIDNIGQSLQQSLTQLITALLTIVGVLIIMFVISPILAVISILAVPAALVMTILIVSRSQKQFIAQWAS
ncbi:MAG: ABC transporter ATP-binding protein, partial [Chloroflexi bacterium]|nr:ABC transporter ATP-binding protein [Chloroflexota bacterium]